MKKTAYKLDFVNNGEPFKLGSWTVGKQEEILKETAEFEDKLSEKELDKKYRRLIILKGLHEVDENVSEDDLINMHPDDLIAIFAAVYLQGKRGILAAEKKDFQKGKNPKQTK